MKRLRGKAKDQIRVTQLTEGSRRGKEFRHEVLKKMGASGPKSPIVCGKLLRGQRNARNGGE